MANALGGGPQTRVIPLYSPKDHAFEEPEQVRCVVRPGKLGTRLPTLFSFWAYSQLVRSAKCVRHGTTTLVEGNACGRRKSAFCMLSGAAALHPGRHGPEAGLGTWFSCPCTQNPNPAPYVCIIASNARPLALLSALLSYFHHWQCSQLAFLPPTGTGFPRGLRWKPGTQTVPCEHEECVNDNT